MAEPAELEPTHKKCLDCGVLDTDITWDECKSCGSENRAFEFVQRLAKPLGRPDDAEHHIAAGPWGREVWEYPAKEPEPEA